MVLRSIVEHLNTVTTQIGLSGPNPSSASRFTAGAFGFLTLIQCGGKRCSNFICRLRRMRAQADMEGKSHYAACSRGSLGPDLFLTELAQTLTTVSFAF